MRRYMTGRAPQFTYKLRRREHRRECLGLAPTQLSSSHELDDALFIGSAPVMPQVDNVGRPKPAVAGGDFGGDDTDYA
jgi:hypothetical protein